VKKVTDRQAPRAVMDFDVDEVSELFAEQVRTDKCNLETYRIFTDIFLKNSDRKNALQTISRINKLPRKNINYQKLQHIHQYYKSIGCQDIAIQTAKALYLNAGNDMHRLARAGSELGGLRQHESALKCFRKLVAKRPGDALSHFLLGTALNACNQPVAAENAFKRAISIDKALYPSYLSLSQVRKQTDASNHVRLLKNRVTQTRGNQQASRFLNFALAKELDDLGRYEQAFACLKKANEAVSIRHPYNHRSEQEVFERVTSCFLNLSNRNVQGYASTAPIFIIGMPRSGTTLVERVFAANGQVHPGGELHDFIGQFVYQYGPYPERQNLPSIFSRAGKFDYEQIGKGYVDAVLSRCAHRQFFTDKMPFNYRYIGLIKLALPNARIVHVKRDPRATLFSNYQQNYKDGINLWSYEKSAAAQYYGIYQKYMDFWKAALPNGFIDVEYEDLVENFETVSRRLYGYCDLEWTGECLQFHRLNIHSGTQSSAQVRRPVYRSSLHKWKNYQAQLAEWQNLNGAGVS
jgi:tetratricopeptide (TPR) repeat protein